MDCSPCRTGAQGSGIPPDSAPFSSPYKQRAPQAPTAPGPQLHPLPAPAYLAGLRSFARGSKLPAFAFSNLQREMLFLPLLQSAGVHEKLLVGDTSRAA